MQRLEVSGAVRPIYGSLGVKRLIFIYYVAEFPETVRLNRLRWFGHVQRLEKNIIPKRVLYMNLGSTRLRSRPRNRWQYEVGEDGRPVGGEGWQEKVHNREEWKKLLRTERNSRIC